MTIVSTLIPEAYPRPSLSLIWVRKMAPSPTRSFVPPSVSTRSRSRVLATRSGGSTNCTQVDNTDLATPAGRAAYRSKFLALRVDLVYEFVECGDVPDFDENFDFCASAL